MINYKYSTLAVAIVALLSGCGAEDNKSLVSNNDNILPPIVKGDVTIPALHVGLTVQGAYQYFDPNPAARPEGNSLYSWRYGDVELSTKKSLDLNYEFYDLVGTDGNPGESIEFCVTPIAQGSNTSVGEETCSELREVKDALGPKPTVTDVVFDVSNDIATPKVGQKLIATYKFQSADGSTYTTNATDEGDSLVVWYTTDTNSNKEKIKTAIIADDNTLKLTPRNSEGKQISYCVVAISAELVPGYEVCTALTGTVDMADDNDKPYVVDLDVVGQPIEYTALTGRYTWKDDDDDVQAPSIYSWKRGSDVIEGQTSISYETSTADKNKYISFCVQPFASTGMTDGDANLCVQMSETIKENTEIAPTATATIIGAEDGIEVGDELAGSYVYHQEDDVGEGDTTAWWQIGTDEPVACDNKDNCNYTLTTADLEKDVRFCVLPVTENKKPASENQCSNSGLQPSGIKLSGVLEYDNTLNATVYGYTLSKLTVDASNGEWKVDVYASGLETQKTSDTYKIGVRGPVLTDFAWTDKADKLDARNFIGQDVQYCVSTDDGDKCVFASQFDEVTGGLYTDETDNKKRFIEPVRTYKFTSGNDTVTYHRPLTVAESKLKTLFGTDIPSAMESTKINGIEWALFEHDNNGAKDVLNVCRNLYNKKEWHLPEGFLSRKPPVSYINNMYESDGNRPSIVGATSLNNLTKKIISSTYNSKEESTDFAKDISMSRVFGWPTSSSSTDRIAYASATQYIAAPANRTYAIRFSDAGSSTTSAVEGTYLFVSCIR